MRQVLFALGAFVAVGLSPLLVLASPQDLRTGEPVLVISAPWNVAAAEVISLSGLREISPERAPFGALTVMDDTSDVLRLKRNGAWFVLDGKLIAQICAS